MYGPDLGDIKGKSTTNKPAPITSDLIGIPDEFIRVQEDVTLSMDGLTVNGLNFLTTISHDIYYRTAQPLSAKPNYQEFIVNLKEIELLYRKAGFKLSEIHADSQFKKTLKEFSCLYDPVINVNLASAGEHVPWTERNNRVIKERVRAAYHQLPVPRLPKLLITYLVMNLARKLNFFPAKHGLSKH